MKKANDRNRAKITTAIVIVLAIFMGSYRSISRLNKDVLAAFSDMGDDSYSIAELLDEKIVGAHNVATVAKKYMGDSAANKLYSIISALDKAETAAEKSRENTNLDTECKRLEAELSALSIKEADENALRRQLTNMEAANDIIERNGYNNKVAELDKKLDSFPANVLLKLYGIKRADKF